MENSFKLGRREKKKEKRKKRSNPMPLVQTVLGQESAAILFKQSNKCKTHLVLKIQ